MANKFSVILSFLAVTLIGMAFGFEVTFETQAELDLIGSSNTCHYVENYEELCKYSPAHPGSLGYWSSCDDLSCEITIPIGNILNSTGELPTQVRVLSYVMETRAEMRIRYRLNPDSMVVNLNPPIAGSRDWTASDYYDLENINGLNPESEVIIRISSNPFFEDADLLDKIIFNFRQSTDAPPQPSTTEDPTCFEEGEN